MCEEWYCQKERNYRTKRECDQKPEKADDLRACQFWSLDVVAECDVRKAKAQKVKAPGGPTGGGEPGAMGGGQIASSSSG